MTTNENTGNTSEPTALDQMISKLDNRDRDSRGYVTYTPELVRILSELSPNVPVSILQSRTPYPDDNNDYINVEVKLGFLLSRSELAELQAKKAAEQSGE